MPASDRLLGGPLQDVRLALRVWRRRPGTALPAILTMALGIAATTVLFSVADGVLLAPLPWPESDHLVRLSETRQGGSSPLSGILTNGTYLAWAERPVTLDGLAAWQGDRRMLTGRGEPERLDLAAVTPSLFPLLRARPVLGRTFGPDEDRSASVVLSFGLWQQRFGGSKEALGRLLELDGESYRVLGVMPADFAFPDRTTRAWVPFPIEPVVGSDPEARSVSMFRAIGRLRPGASSAQASAEGTARARAAPDLGMVATAVFGSDGPVEVSVEPLLDAMTAEVRPAILVLLVAVGLLLAAATANVVSLLLAGASTRQREVAIRAAVGADGGSLARQLLIEGACLGLAGGAAGLALAVALSGALPWFLPADFPRLDEVSLDLRVLSFTLALSLGIGVVLGLVPVFYSRRLDLTTGLRVGGTAAATVVRRSGTVQTRRLVIVAQVAIACVLLVGTALLGRSFAAMLDADLGYDPANVLTARLILPEVRYTGRQRGEQLSSIIEQVRAVPGVRTVGVVNSLPLTGGEAMMAFALPTPSDPDARAQAQARVVSPGYLAALGLRVVEGRGFTEADRLGATPVAVVNESFARRYLPAPRLGARLPLRIDGEHEDVEVVGVLADVRHRGAADVSRPELYFSYAQRAEGYGSADAYLVARTDGDPAELVPILRDIVHRSDPLLAIESVMSMEDRVWSSLAQPRRYAALLGAFGFFALAIAGAGVFGILSYSVARRRREIGVRAALGATARDLVLLVVGQGLILVLGGLGLGLVASIWLGRLLETLLFGVSAHDPLSFFAAPAVLLAVALAACALPAVRAVRTDPQRVLRAE